MTDTAAPHVDLLTGAYRREHFDALVAREAAEARHAGLPISVLHVDVDDLTELNDVHGRERVDGALATLAATIAAEVDGRGPIGRTGGGALTVFVRGLDRASAVQLAQRIRRRVKHTTALPFTVSIGVAARKPSEPVLNLLEAAQVACLRAKQSGRDSVVSR